MIALVELEAAIRVQGQIRPMDRASEALRGGRGANLTGIIYLNGWAYNSCSTDAGDEGRGLDPLHADADGVGLTISTWVSYIDIVVARVQTAAGSSAHCNVVASCVSKTAQPAPLTG